MGDHMIDFLCKTCGAKPGEICRTKNGKPYPPPHYYHADRVYQWLDAVKDKRIVWPEEQSKELRDSLLNHMVEGK